ncbi:exodeoxyribonuclease VII large subunit [bacterium]|nr:exodeoxyribonuclease VII large subunit [bacterium]
MPASTLSILEPKNVVSVTELTRDIKNLLSDNFTDVWVTGEVSNLKLSANGHTYFTLKDAGASVSAVFFKYSKQYKRCELEDGMEVTLHGRLSVYEPRGQYQLVVDFVEPKGLGALMMAFEQLKKKLTDEGLFEESNKRELPLMPRRVGLITSPQGAVVHDMVTVMRRRFPNVDIVLYPVTVQGEGASQAIAKAIGHMDTIPDIDVLIVGRGGGSMEDLWAFNEEILVRAVAACKKPIVSAVGHETDFTLCDFAADVRAPTPSAAAELVMPLKEDLFRRLTEIKIVLIRSLQLFIERESETLKHYKKSLKDPLQVVDDHVLDLDNKTQKMILVCRHYLKIKMMEFMQTKTQLLGLSPMAPLEKGYAIIYNNNNQVVKTTAGLKEQNEYTVHLKDGKKTVRLA